MEQLASTACLRCRGQKLRCSKEQPKCSRCKRLGAQCVFPESTHRKTKSSTQRKDKTTAPHSDEGYSSLPGPSQSNASDIAHDLQRLLLDIFFDVCFNATLFFHKPNFLQDFEAGRTPKHVLLSMFAISSIYLTTPSIMVKYDAVKLSALGDPKLLGIGCATQAGSIVLQTVDVPSLNGASTCFLLGLFWFAQGDASRNVMFLGIAHRGARALVQETMATNPHKDWHAAELERRVFWATWMANCVNCDHYVNGTSADSFVLSLPLPVSTEAFEQGRCEPMSTLADASELDSVDHPRPAPGDKNILTEVMRLVLHWAKIQDHIEDRKRTPAKQSLINLLDLDHWLQSFIRNIAPELAYSKQALFEHASIRGRLLFPVLHSMFHQCRMVLHATVVPQFGGLSSQTGISPETVRISAETALKHANSIADIAEDFIELGLDASLLAPFQGYCTYVSATVHTSMVSSTDVALAMRARRGLVATLRIVKMMGPQWDIMNKLWARIHVLYDAQLSRMPMSAFDDSETYCSPIDKHAREIDKIAALKRKVGRLTEPLSDPILRYSTQKLRQIINVDESSVSAKDLGNAIIEQSLDVGAGRDESGFASILSDDFGVRGQQSYTDMSYTPANPVEPYMIDGVDWSHFDMDSLLLPFSGNEMQGLVYDIVSQG